MEECAGRATPPLGAVWYRKPVQSFGRKDGAIGNCADETKRFGSKQVFTNFGANAVSADHHVGLGAAAVVEDETDRGARFLQVGQPMIESHDFAPDRLRENRMQVAAVDAEVWSAESCLAL